MESDIYSAIDRDERISQYLKGQMNAQEESQFLSDMESDEQLKQDAIAQARLIKGMAQVDHELIQELKNASEAQIVSSHSRKRIFRKPVIWVSTAASVVILLFAGYKGYDYYNTTRLGMEYAAAFPLETLVRGNTDSNVETELQTLFGNIMERKDLKATTERLSDLWALSNQDTYNDYTDYAPYIGWYLAIGYLEDYEKEKAIHVLKQLNNHKEFSTAIIINTTNLLKSLQ